MERVKLRLSLYPNISNQAVTDAFQSIILPNRIIPAVKCLYCHLQMASGTSRQQAHLNQCTACINRPINGPAALVQTMLPPAIKPLSTAVIKTVYLHERINA